MTTINFVSDHSSFKILPKLNKDMIMNNSPTAGTTLGFKHKPEFGLSRSGSLNPMSNRTFSSEFIAINFFPKKKKKKGTSYQYCSY